MLIKDQITFEALAWKSGMEEWLSLYAIYFEKNLEIIPELKKKFLLQKILNYLGATKTNFQIMIDTAFDEELTVDGCKRGNEQIDEIIPMVKELAKM